MHGAGLENKGLGVLCPTGPSLLSLPQLLCEAGQYSRVMNPGFELQPFARKWGKEFGGRATMKIKKENNNNNGKNTLESFSKLGLFWLEV